MPTPSTLKLGLPCTFPVHQGHSNFWISPSGHRSRIDYVAIPRSMLADVQTSCVDPDLDHLTSHGDHQAVKVVIPLRCATGGRDVNAQARINIPADQREQWQSALAEAPLASWSIPVDDHQKQFMKLMHGAACRCARAQSSAVRPVKPYVSSSVLQGLAFRKDLRGVLAQAEEARSRAVLSACFAL